MSIIKWHFLYKYFSLYSIPTNIKTCIFPNSILFITGFFSYFEINSFVIQVKLYKILCEIIWCDDTYPNVRLWHLRHVVIIVLVPLLCAGITTVGGIWQKTQQSYQGVRHWSMYTGNELSCMPLPTGTFRDYKYYYLSCTIQTKITLRGSIYNPTSNRL